MVTSELATNKPSTIAESKYVALENFLLEYANKEDGYKYEWNNGIIEKSEKMNQEQTTIFILLMRLFTKTKAFQEGGCLVAETDMFTSDKQLRRPDILFFRGDQINAMKNGENQIATWVAEVISKNDGINPAIQKVEEYFAAGVQVVWQIFPLAKKVYVYTSPEEVKICSGDTACSAAPALDDFEIVAKTIFE